MINIVSKIFLIIILSVALLFGKANKEQFDSVLYPTPTPVVLNARKIFDLINTYRTDHGISALQWKDTICPLAQERLQDIHTDWSHDKWLPELYQQPYYKSYHSSQQYYGENLVEGQSWSEEQVVISWEQSPGHLANIMKAQYVYTCVTTDMNAGTSYAVQEFTSDY